ncbi:hypothetical protein IEO21_05963 [Rhodonia placenta]|uniref:RNA-dependent RNA polymerase n=1 Tax=Rhodonia placenta TaxID=104341 RepID=A0A8H7U120_9APHY|nr:hypothetical protein IEO21_05963 [Postia placenta]
MLENVDDFIRAVHEGDHGIMPAGEGENAEAEVLYVSLGKRKASVTSSSSIKRIKVAKTTSSASLQSGAKPPTYVERALAENTNVLNAAIEDSSNAAVDSSSSAAVDDPGDADVTPQSSGRTLVAEAGPVVVAHCHALRGYVGQLPFGVQWEIARFVNAGFAWDKFTVDGLLELAKLGSNAKAAPEVARIVAENLSEQSENTKDMRADAFASAYAKERSVKLPWDELDKEDTILKHSPHGGLGCNEKEPYLMDDPWYGGRIHFTAKVVLSNMTPEDKNETFSLRLDRPVLGSSNLFARRFGSRKFIRVRMSKDIYMGPDKKAREELLMQFFQRSFVINGFVYKAFYAKEQNVFLFQTNEFWDGDRICDPKLISLNPLHRELSFIEFINFHNDLTCNKDQTMVKWAARFALGLSNSVPGLRLHPSNIAFEEDIVCSAWKGEGKVPNEQIMTDGCGLIRLDILQQIADRLAWPMVPMAIQVRICGSKVKIKHAVDGKVPLDIDPAMLTIDVLRPSRMTSPARLSTETIINLAENGVHTSVFVKLMQESMQKKVEGLTTWQGDYGLYRLWMNVARAGGIVSARLAREAAGAARAKGYVFEDFTDEAGDEDGFDQMDKALEDHSTAWWDDPISGCPSTLEETVLVLLDSGFKPDTCPVLAAKLKEVVKRAINSYVRRYRVDVPQSCTAYIVPDPLGVLEPGQVHIKSSRRNLVDQDGRPTDIVLGEVLVTRHPCKVPTDVQKVTAVFNQKLSSYVDVIVVSIKDHVFNKKLLNRHLASCTGGGDYDGDTMEAFWNPALVEGFRNAETKFLNEPKNVEKCLVKNTETVAQFLSRNPLSTDKDIMQPEIQKYLLGSLRDSSMVGTYSTWWENAIYRYGYQHNRTVFLAYMFCAILDGSKTGVMVAQAAYESHRKQYAHRPPVWKETDEERERLLRAFTNDANLQRERRLGPFVMDEIYKQVNKESNKQLRHVEEVLTAKVAQLDEQLAAPWREAVTRVTLLAKRGNPDAEAELQAICSHVEQEGRGVAGPNGNPNAKTKSGFTGLPIEKRQDKLRELSKEFHAAQAEPLLYFSEADLRRVRASFAFVFDHETSRDHWSRFPWDVAMRTLCEIKAGALGLSKTTDNTTQRIVRRHWVIDPPFYLEHKKVVQNTSSPLTRRGVLLQICLGLLDTVVAFHCWRDCWEFCFLLGSFSLRGRRNFCNCIRYHCCGVIVQSRLIVRLRTSLELHLLWFKSFGGLSDVGLLYGLLRGAISSNGAEGPSSCSAAGATSSVSSEGSETTTDAAWVHSSAATTPSSERASGSEEVCASGSWGTRGGVEANKPWLLNGRIRLALRIICSRPWGLARILLVDGRGE